MNLFPYQIECVEAIRRDLLAGFKRLLIKAPCAFGKTIVFCYLAKKAKEQGKKIVIIMDSVFLVEQTLEKLESFAKDSGVYCGTLNKKELRDITVATIQSLKDFSYFDVVIIDECHIGVSRYEKLLRDYQGKVFGFTATPFSAKGIAIYGEDKFFTKLTFSMTPMELISLNRLTPLVYGTEKEETKIDLRKIPIVNGDYKENELQKVYEIEKEKVNLQVEDMLTRTVNRKKVIIMTTGINHADYIESILPSSVAYHSGMDNNLRNDKMKKFKDGEVKFLIGVMAIYKGLDIPEADCLVNMRPTRSYSLYVQMAGRVVRACTNKKDAAFLDYGQTVEALGFYEEIKETTRKTTKGITPEYYPKKCPECYMLVKPQVKFCECGHVFKVISTLNLTPTAFVTQQIYSDKIISVKIDHNYVSKSGNAMKKITVVTEKLHDLWFFYPEFKRYEFFSIIKELEVGKIINWSMKGKYPEIKGITDEQPINT
jgi:DNA repair protein RadD